MFRTSLMFLMVSLIGLSLVGAQVAVEEGEATVTSDGQTVNITCDNGLVVTLIDITFNNQTYTLVDCVEGCAAFPVANGDDVPVGTLNGATGNISCDAGMEAVPDTVTCLNGEWCVSNAICVETCGELVVTNGETVPAGAFQGETVTIACNEGLLASPAETATCSKGAWSVSNVTCASCAELHSAGCCTFDTSGVSDIEWHGNRTATDQYPAGSVIGESQCGNQYTCISSAPNLTVTDDSSITVVFTCNCPAPDNCTVSSYGASNPRFGPDFNCDDCTGVSCASTWPC